MVQFIHYELKGHRPRFRYGQVADAIRNISGIYSHIPESTWLVETEKSTMEVRDLISPCLFAGDLLFVIRVYNDWASLSLSQAQVEWLNGRKFNSPSSTLAGLFMPQPPPLLTLAKLVGG